MLEDSLAVFRNNDVETVTPAQGVMLIDGWLQALQGDPNLEPMRQQMTELRAELQSPTPNSQRIKLLLNELANHAQQAAEAPTSEGTGRVVSKVSRNYFVASVVSYSGFCHCT